VARLRQQTELWPEYCHVSSLGLPQNSALFHFFFTAVNNRHAANRVAWKKGVRTFERSKTPVPVLHGGLGLPQKCHHLQSSGRSRPRSALAAVRNLDNRSVASLQSVQSCSSCVSFQRPRLGLSGEHAVSQSTAVLGPAHIILPAASRYNSSIGPDGQHLISTFRPVKCRYQMKAYYTQHKGCLFFCSRFGLHFWAAD
jgi:hypothetical protein